MAYPKSLEQCFKELIRFLDKSVIVNCIELSPDPAEDEIPRAFSGKLIEIKPFHMNYQMVIRLDAAPHVEAVIHCNEKDFVPLEEDENQKEDQEQDQVTPDMAPYYILDDMYVIELPTTTGAGKRVYSKFDIEDKCNFES